MSSTIPYPPGTAPLKREYLLQIDSQNIPDDDAAEGNTRARSPRTATTLEQDADVNSRGSSGKRTKEQKKAQRGANKGRRYNKVRDEVDLCWRVATGKECEFGSECRFTHDVTAYLSEKPRDIHYCPSPAFSLTAPFVEQEIGTSDPDERYHSLDYSTTCPVFSETGACPRGLKCRYLGAHVRKDEKDELALIIDEEKLARSIFSSSEMNIISPESMKLLRTKKFPHPKSDAYIKELRASEENGATKAASAAETQHRVAPSVTNGSPPMASHEDIVSGRIRGQPVGRDTPDVPARFTEKKSLNWSDKTYLAPLTTVGNLPFRRICVDYGADITCGEMGLASSFLAGSKEEWSLVKRHPSERTFGVQLAGNKASLLVPTAEIMAKEFGDNLDFVDINCGCPIDLVFRTGSGSALLDGPAKLGKMVVGMNRVLGDIPVTVKLRTGVKEGRNNAHKLMPRLRSEYGVCGLTLHGRTRQQRYTKLADWPYIKECVGAVRAREADEDLPRIPIFGGGDCYSSEGYWSCVEESGVDGVMIGRGALIKPWIFTEVKERREWDITPQERLESIRKLAEYGVTHFGSDTAGVNTARRYVCEALSFQYRYVPIGLLEILPGRINDRAPAFRGRNELETLLASPNSSDWVKISEMFLGPAPESWTFTPKHKSNATEQNQG